MSNHPSGASHPIVTVVVAAFNVERYVDEALGSIRRQSLEAIEILVVDDQSTDGTRDCLDRHAAEDRRVRLLQGEARGPAAARNRAIREARGDWLAIVDADDVISPDRLERLSAAGSGYDAVADNMIAFYEGRGAADHPWIDPSNWPSPRALLFDDLMAGGLGTPPAPELGYLKPLLRRDRLARLGGYREDLMIGEDFDLMARWTAAGFSYLYQPEAGYRYRRRSDSLSYRLSSGQIDQMIAALAALDRSGAAFHAASVARRTTALRDLQRYSHRIDRLKRLDPIALAALLLDQDDRARLARSAREGLGRRVARRP